MYESFLNLGEYQDTTIVPKINIEHSITKISIDQFDSIIEQSRNREREYQLLIARQKEQQALIAKRDQLKKINFDTTKLPYLNGNKSLKNIYLSLPEKNQFKLSTFDINETVQNDNVFIAEKNIEKNNFVLTAEKANNRYKPSWFLGVFILLFLIFAWISIRFKKQFNKYFTAIISYQASANMYRNKNLLIQRVSFQMNILFVLTGGLYLVQLMEFLEFKFELKQMVIILLAFSAPLIYIVYKFILARLVGYFSYQVKLFDEFYFNTTLHLKLIGLICLPLIVLIPYLNSVPQDILFSLSFILFGIVLIMWVLRTFQIFIRKGVSIFFLILYLCALEILPILILVKLISVRG